MTKKSFPQGKTRVKITTLQSFRYAREGMELTDGKIGNSIPFLSRVRRTGGEGGTSAPLKATRGRGSGWALKGKRSLVNGSIL